MSFNIYGFLVGIGAVVSILLIEKKAEDINFRFKNIYFDLSIILISSIFFARLWHVLTDFHLYKDNWIEAFQFWNGGMSILGAILGSVIAIYICSKVKKYDFLKFLDLMIFGLPFAQSIGRWGNYFNQELYGWETNLPWAIEISGKNYHPLFLYESILTLLFGIFAWFKFNNKSIGRGKIFLTYVIYYSFIRFFLDFIRIDKTMINSWLGVNQLILIFIFIICLSILNSREEKTD